MDSTNPQDFIWSQKYRPKKLEDCVLPASIKDSLQPYIDAGKIPNLLFCGGAGVGKTTAAMAMCDQIGIDYIMVNGSLDMSLDIMRTTIQQFASTVSFSGSQKVIIIDEADGLNNHVMLALKTFLEEYSKSCSFILTANVKHKIIDPLISRCGEVQFSFPTAMKPKLAAQFFKRVCGILNAENITYEKSVVAELVNIGFPDFRKTLNQLQMHASSGQIDVSILSGLGDKSFKELIEILKDKNFTNMRKWVVEYASGDPIMLYRQLFEKSLEVCVPQSVPELVLLLSRYQYQHAFVADKELNTAALLTEIMIGVEFKS